MDTRQFPADDQGSLIAAIDLGSKNFQLIVARLAHGQLNVIERLRESVNLAAGLGTDKRLDAASQERALACLQRFGQYVRDMPPGSVRAVGTNALRSARHHAAFLDRAASTLGHPVEIISGMEEARLVYLGACHSLPAAGGRRLVIDIGGGSTELIIGEGFVPQAMESLYIGCITLTRQFFADGGISAERMQQAEIAAGQELQTMSGHFRRLGWSEVAGTSGSIRAIASLVQPAGAGEGEITLSALQALRAELIVAGHCHNLEQFTTRLDADRIAVLAAAVAILHAAFVCLDIHALKVADGALREGVLYDLMGRIRHEDVRSRTINALCERNLIDQAQAARVYTTASHLLHQVQDAWSLGEEPLADLLYWAAHLHEIGLAVAHNGYHKHGGYLLEFSDMPGFSRQEQKALAVLVRSHRRKFSTAFFRPLPEALQRPLMRLAVILRLAVLLHHSRSDAPLPALQLEVRGRRMRVAFSAGWLEQHPLTRADLEQEAAFLADGKFRLTFS